MGDKARATWHGQTEAEEWRTKAAQAVLDRNDALKLTSLTDPTVSMLIKTLIDILGRTADAMQGQGVDLPTRTRVLNTVLYGHPEGIEAAKQVFDTQMRLIEKTSLDPEAVRRIVSQQT